MRRRPGARDAVGMTTDEHRSATMSAERMGWGYVDAGDIRTYYEVHGTGDPLVLLHGGFCTVETLDGLTSGLAEHYTVYTPERRGHGRTADVDGPITYTAMAADTIAFLDALGVSGAHLVGWSDGAVVALLVARERPDLAGKLVMIGQPVNVDGLPDQMRAVLSHGLTKQMLPPMLEGLYAATSPDGPAHFDVVAEKLFALYKIEPNIELDELAGITAPALMMIGDDDMCTVEHAEAVRRALSAAQLAVVPGASHSLPMDKPGLTDAIVLDFLAG
ncbi:MAG: putative hydrolase [Pseudonocardia sp.]|nr:putative hydrolase [Pseudonocardia sp.]